MGAVAAIHAGGPSSSAMMILKKNQRSAGSPVIAQKGMRWGVVGERINPRPDQGAALVRFAFTARRSDNEPAILKALTLRLLLGGWGTKHAAFECVLAGVGQPLLLLRIPNLLNRHNIRRPAKICTVILAVFPTTCQRFALPSVIRCRLLILSCPPIQLGAVDLKATSRRDCFCYAEPAFLTPGG